MVQHERSPQTANYYGAQAVPEISGELMDGILSVLNSTLYGEVTLVAQNFRLVQIERHEKIRPDELFKKRALPLRPDSTLSAAVTDKIRASWRGLEFGQVVISIKEGRVVQIDRTVKERVRDLSGLYCDGI
ncbi:MAG: YezD family protein [Deltaproteobacteria bacterium]|jgi:hypothetical protein|nr:YezD family protein [Deltaproteobacteria bacterium]